MLKDQDKRCKCGNNIGPDTPAAGKMCMVCWCARSDRQPGTPQADPQPDRPGNLTATLDLDDAKCEERDESFDGRMTEYMAILRYQNDDDDLEPEATT